MAHSSGGGGSGGGGCGGGGSGRGWLSKYYRPHRPYLKNGKLIVPHPILNPIEDFLIPLVSIFILIFLAIFAFPRPIQNDDSTIIIEDNVHVIKDQEALKIDLENFYKNYSCYSCNNYNQI